MDSPTYDLIGDIHGQHEKLVTILHALGYLPRGEFSGWVHPEGRKVIFLGDYIDRGPKVREVLREVRAMVANGDALAILGNHEFSAVLHHASGAPLAKASKDLQGTITQFEGFESEWTGFLDWIRGLPLFLDLGGLRAVHACWDERAIAELQSGTLDDESLLRVCLERSSASRKAAERLLLGPTLSVPDDALVLNSKGMPLPSIRVRWWNLPTSDYPIGDLVFPEALSARGSIESLSLSGFPNYPMEAPPVFFGHYWLPPDGEKNPVTPNLACLDFSAGIGNAPLVAYRWDGEQVLSEEKFFFTVRPPANHD